MSEAEKKSVIASLAAVCEAVANGQFEVMDDLFEIVSDNERPPDMRALAETFAGMVVQVEAREFHANQLIAGLKEIRRQLEAVQQELKRENVDLKQRLKKLEAG